MNMLDVNQRALLLLVRKALWKNAECLPEADWPVVEAYAQGQGVLWMAYLGAKALPLQIPPEQLKTWRTAMHSRVLYNDQLNAVQSMLLEWLAEKKIRVAILKGTSCSQYYPYPDARPLGDIDILIDKENLDIVDGYLKAKGYMPSPHEHDFHVGYYGKDAVIEVHFAATGAPDSKGGKVVAEEMLHFLDDVHMATVGEMTFPVLSDEHQALMLLLHMERHMMVSGIGLRQLCDWAVFVNGSVSTHWQSGTLDLLRRCGLLTYAKVLTKTCVDFLGLDQDKAEWCKDVDHELTQAMIEEVFRGGDLGAADEKGNGSLFTERSRLGQHGQNKLTGMIGRLTTMAYNSFPYTRRYKILLPVFWVYFSVRYLLRFVGGSQSISYAISVSDRRHKLYQALHLYETE